MQDRYVSFSAAWFTLSLVNAGLAQSKRRSGLNWWFASLFIGPLATLLIVAWPPGDQVMPAAAGAMSRNQAIVAGLGIILIALVIFGFASLGGR
jgi:hypothetical protein